MKRVIERLERAQGLLAVAVHENPDGDAVGSGLALYRFLLKKGKRALPVCASRVPETYDFLWGFGDFVRQVPPEAELLLLLDSTDPERAGVKEWKGELIRIDHHEGGEFPPLSLVDPGAPSTGNVVLDLLRAWDPEAIDPEIAQALYTALLTDTLRFTTRVSKRAFEDAAFLVERGASPAEIANLVYRRKRVSELCLLRRALESLRLAKGGKIAYLVVRLRDLEACGAEPYEAENLVDYPLSLRGVILALKFQETKSLWRVSVRSKPPASAERVARALGGGGHLHAAGCKLRGGFEEVLSRVMGEAEAEVDRALQAA